MKRETFRITSDAGHELTATKWNASIRKIETTVRAIATAEGTKYLLVTSKSLKGPYGYVKGSREWRSDHGRTILFSIEKVG